MTWATNPVNREEPSPGLKVKGFTPGKYISAAILNWLFHQLFEHDALSLASASIEVSPGDSTKVASANRYYDCVVLTVQAGSINASFGLGRISGGGSVSSVSLEIARLVSEANVSNMDVRLYLFTKTELTIYAAEGVTPVVGVVSLPIAPKSAYDALPAALQSPSSRTYTEGALTGDVRAYLEIVVDEDNDLGTALTFTDLVVEFS